MSTTREEQIAAIRAACIKANPEIVELKFGCVVRHTPVKDLGIDYRGVYMHPARGKGMHLLFFEGERTGSQLPYSTTISEKDFEIIGRPIRLADVLLAIQNTGAVVAFYGNDRLWICEPDLAANINGRKNGTWKLRTDDLTAQSDECISFLAQLLAA